jgi:hypothetical protein
VTLQSGGNRGVPGVAFDDTIFGFEKEADALQWIEEKSQR